jgi:putative spermidine/putrescine transport system permease protein
MMLRPRGMFGHRVFKTMFVSTIAWTAYAFLLVPNLIVIPMSFGNRYAYEFPPRSFSLFLYTKFFTSPDWVGAALLSFRVAMCAAAIAVLLGVPAAYGLVRGTYPGKQVITLFLLSPLLVPAVVIAFSLYLYFGQLRLGGTTIGLILAHAMFTVPFVLVTAMAGLKHVDPNLEAAASIMGASPLYIFWHVTVPLLRPAIGVGALFAFLMSFDEVVIAFFILDPTSFTLPVKMYNSIIFDTSPVLAAVSSLLAVLSILICCLGAFLRKSE